MSDTPLLTPASELPHPQETADQFVNELCEQIRKACEQQTQLRARGGSSKPFLLSDRVATLDISSYSGVIDYAPSELVISARAGTSIREIVELTAASGQMLPFEPAAFDDRATLGGVVASGLAGPASHFVASVRDCVLGIACVNGQGDFLRFGGRVIKNVAGFDLARLLVGSMGTLAVITELAIKLVPQPHAEITLAREVRLEDAVSTMRSIAVKAFPVTASAWSDGVWRLRLSGAAAAIEKAKSEIGANEDPSGKEFWDSLCEFSHPYFRSDARFWRINMPPSSSLPEIDGDWLIDAGGALRWLKLSDDRPEEPQLDTSKAIAQGFFGAAGQYIVDASTQNVRSNIKRSFDPQGVFPHLSEHLAC